MHDAEIGTGFDLQGVVVLHHQGNDGRFDLGEQFGDIDALDQHIHLAGLDLGEIEDVVDEAEEVLAGGANSAEVGDNPILLEFRGFLDQHFAVADDGIERRAQFVAHIGKKLALRLICRVGLQLGFFEFGLAALEFGNVGVNADDAAAGRQLFADADPIAGGIVLFDDALRILVLLEAIFEPVVCAQVADIGDPAIESGGKNIAECHAGNDHIRQTGEQRAIITVGDDQVVVGVEEHKSFGYRLDRRFDRASLRVRFRLKALAFGIAGFEQG